FNSVSIMSDAVHDLGDSISIGFAWFFQGYSEKKQDERFTFGYNRFSLLGALITGVVLISGSFFMIYRSVPRLIDPQPVNYSGMFWLSLVAIALNGYAAWILSKGTSKNESMLNLHMLEDVLGWIGVLIVSILMNFTEAYRLDPILSILIALYILYKTVPEFFTTMKILLNGSPENVNVKSLADSIKNVPAVKDLSHFHIWSLDGEENALIVTVLIDPSDIDKAREIKEEIAEVAHKSSVENHITIEITTSKEELEKGYSHNT
ncbi:MAG: cation diffusion facilitator family transporter, partial [Enterococcus faecium]